MTFDPASLVPATFLRCPVGGGVSPAMRDALAKAEASIVRDYPDRWDAIFKRVGTVGGYRPSAGKHSLGIAVDLDYLANPYVATRKGAVFGGERAGAALSGVREDAVAASDRACVALDGKPADLEWRRPGESTADVWTRLDRVSRAWVAYFAPLFDPHAPTIARSPRHDYRTADAATLRAEMGSDLLPGADLTTADALQRLRDYESVRVPTVVGAPVAFPRVTRNPARGFLTIPQEVAVALSDVAGMRWGACDFGSESADVMHFDTPGARHV